jgi:hypothetical protein
MEANAPIIKEGKEDAPNYRKANQKDGKKEPMCSACVHNVDGECEKFDFIFDRGYTCDALERKTDNQDL